MYVVVTEGGVVEGGVVEGGVLIVVFANGNEDKDGVGDRLGGNRSGPIECVRVGEGGNTEGTWSGGMEGWWVCGRYMCRRCLGSSL